MKVPLTKDTTNKVSYKHVANLLRKHCFTTKHRLTYYKKSKLTDTYTVKTNTKTYKVTLTKINHNTTIINII